MSIFDYILAVLPGLPVSLSLTFTALITAFLLSVLFTLVLSLKPRVLTPLVKGYITLFTGTPLLVAQFEGLKNYPLLWELMSSPWLCAMVTLALNSAAYSTLLFYGAVKAIPKGQWQSCQALGMSQKQTMRIILPYAFKRALSSYSNEVVLIFKSTSLATTISLLEVMGYSRRLFGQDYDLNVFIAAGIIYLAVNSLLTLAMRLIERRALAFEHRN